MLGQYKKSYDGDYTKTYKDYIKWRKESAARKKEYDVVSKKLNDTPYNKKERLSNYDTVGNRPKESERVYADGRTNATDRSVKREWNDQKSYKTSDRETQQRQSTTQIRKEAPPTTSIEEERRQPIHPPTSPTPSQVKPKASPIKESEVQKPWKNAYEVEDEEDDGNYNFYDYPIEEIGIGRYRNAKTNKELTLEQAKKVLSLAGFAPKPHHMFGAAIFVFIAANIIFPYVSPLVPIGYGLFRLKSEYTIWERATANQKFKYSLPASDTELAANKMTGKILIGIGIAIAIFRYLPYL